MAAPSPINKLSDDLFIHILGYCNFRENRQISQVNQRGQKTADQALFETYSLAELRCVRVALEECASHAYFLWPTPVPRMPEFRQKEFILIDTPEADRSAAATRAQALFESCLNPTNRLSYVDRGVRCVGAGSLTIRVESGRTSVRYIDFTSPLRTLSRIVSQHAAAAGSAE